MWTLHFLEKNLGTLKSLFSTYSETKYESVQYCQSEYVSQKNCLEKYGLKFISLKPFYWTWVGKETYRLIYMKWRRGR
jgi:hypothetical protein